ncbi:MAG: hypothetical protein NTV02_02605 [Candidatus Zambryskibacteria bacterium]|nr:hypothetical protein [Candidatus Zambryskibacteria bacterium]
MAPQDDHEDFLKERRLEPVRPDRRMRDKNGLAVFTPRREASLPHKQAKEDAVALTQQLWHSEFTPVQRRVVQGFLIEQKSFDDIAAELSCEYVRVCVDDVVLAYACACDLVNAAAFVSC